MHGGNVQALGAFRHRVLTSYTAARMRRMQNDCPSRQGKST
ncbi:hypothetical protein K788_0005403 [Paraburkholderia caribensis MBA4]|uniref:Uncharacterized protein n=1 Tax=Paraburkholderia caribensis MBA4 TaxID=1323664 RepID=A0A0P0RFX5_9BURK|nr:hypothetical protein K788_0005403 [Paraburkholderia caribensis MBA4]